MRKRRKESQEHSLCTCFPGTKNVITMRFGFCVWKHCTSLQTVYFISQFLNKWMTANVGLSCFFIYISCYYSCQLHFLSLLTLVFIFFIFSSYSLLLLVQFFNEIFLIIYISAFGNIIVNMGYVIFYILYSLMFFMCFETDQKVAAYIAICL